jgi:hypothetical protein
MMVLSRLGLVAQALGAKPQLLGLVEDLNYPLAAGKRREVKRRFAVLGRLRCERGYEAALRIAARVT